MPGFADVAVKALAGAGAQVAPGKAFSIPSDIKWMDQLQLEALTEAFRSWYRDAPHPATRRSRGRVWLIFLLLRYTGARLGEVLALDDQIDVALKRGTVRLGRRDEAPGREIQLPDPVVDELKAYLLDPDNRPLLGRVFHMDQGFIRKKFYERAEEASLPKELVNASVLRKSRAIELLRSDVPLTVVQSMLGHSTSNLTASYVDYSDEDVKRILGQFISKETKRKTSARNAFYGKVTDIKRGDIQSQVELTTLGGLLVYAVITNDSLESLELSWDKMATAVIKAPWVVLATDEARPHTSARNTFRGRVTRVAAGKISAEVIVELDDTTRICAIVTRDSVRSLDLSVGNQAWVMFSAYSVILDLD